MEPRTSLIPSPVPNTVYRPSSWWLVRMGELFPEYTKISTGYLTLMDGRANITQIDEDDKVVVFDQFGRKKKITGTKMGAILGCSRFSTPFKVALEIARIYPGDPPNKFIDAGNILEPVIRSYVSENVSLLPDMLGVTSGAVEVEEPVDKDKCGYDHFHDNDVFGGLVDGYIKVDGRRTAILEIKTSSHRDAWLDENGNFVQVPPDYMLQAGLYAALSGLDDIIFAVGFLEPEDYDRPRFWKPTPENCLIVHVPTPSDIHESMKKAEDWYHLYKDNGETPAWDQVKDDNGVEHPDWLQVNTDLLAWIRKYDPKKAQQGRVGTQQEEALHPEALPLNRLEGVRHPLAVF